MGLVNVKDLLLNVIANTNTALHAEDNWFTQNSKILNGLVGINPYVVEYLRLNPDKYPNIVCLRPFDETVGSDFTTVTIPKIVIVTDYPEQDNLTDREETTIKPVLFPAYEAFMQQLVQHPNVTESDWTTVPHTRSVQPGWQPADSQLEQYLDAIVLYDLKIKLFSPLNC
jgi:hypothetical protein